jgi:phage-related protein
MPAAKLAVDVIVNSKDAQKQLGDTSKDIEGLEGSTDKTTKGMSAALAGFLGGAAFGAVQTGFRMLKDLIGDSIKAASDLNESTSQTGQIFGAAADDITRFADKSAATLGLSKRAAYDAANTFATFGKAAGLTGQDLTGFSTDLVTLSADLASFKNTTPEEAATALGAALRGESEPIRKYGVLLDDATLKARAMKMGLIQTTNQALTPQQKALAAQAEIMAQTADAQGDFARTSDGLANQQRIVAAQWEDMQATLGQALLPILTTLGSFLTTTIIPALQTVAKFVADNAAIFLPLAAGIAAVVLSLKAWTIAQAAWNAVMAANPIFLIIGAVIALGALLVWLFNNNESFRAGVMAAWEGIKIVVGAVVDAIGTAFSWLVNSALPAVLGAFSAVFGAIGAVVSWLWESVVQPVIGFIVGAFQLWWAVVSFEIDLIIGAIKLVASVVSWLWSNVLSPVIGFIIDGFKFWAAVAVEAIGIIIGVFQGLVSFISSAISRIAAVGATMWNWVAAGLVQVWDWITGTWNRVIDFIGGITGRITAAASGMWDGIWEAFKGAINLIIRGWNSLEFKLPAFDVGPVHWDGFTLGVPKIDYLAAGGVVRRPTLAVVGEAGPEIVSPIPTLRRLIAEGAAGAGTVVDARVFNVNVSSSGLGPDSPGLQRDLVEALTRWSARNGPLPASIGG